MARWFYFLLLEAELNHHNRYSTIIIIIIISVSYLLFINEFTVKGENCIMFI